MQLAVHRVLWLLTLEYLEYVEVPEDHQGDVVHSLGAHHRAVVLRQVVLVPVDK